MTAVKFADRPWYKIYITVDGREVSVGVTQSRHEARKTAKEVGGRTRKIAAPKAVVTNERM